MPAEGLRENQPDLTIALQGSSIGYATAVKLLLKVAPAPKQSEDCLYLTVRTPSLETDARLPVMVWMAVMSWCLEV